MTKGREPDTVADGASDVMAEDESVHVPAAAAELAESIEHKGESAFIADISDWDQEDPLP
ncbi:MAG: hypothetical protein ACM30G_12265 [Micromonosporaceae bacterium]